MVMTEARKRANEKWRAAHKDYFADYYRNKYQSDEAYRVRFREQSKQRRLIKNEITQLMTIQV